jgi:hypothetical protein
MTEEPKPREQEVISAAEILAGATVPVRMEIRYELTRERPEGLEKMVPPNLIEKLAGSEERLLEWLAKDEENRVSFLTNPLAALKEAGIELTPAEYEMLVRARNASAPTEFLPPGVGIVSLSVDIDEAEAEEAREAEEPPPPRGEGG